VCSHTGGFPFRSPRDKGSKKNSRNRGPKDLLLANRGEHVEPKPPAAEPDETEVPHANALVQHEHAAVAAHLDRLVQEHHGVLPLLLGVHDPEDQSVLISGPLESATRELCKHLLGGDGVIELDELDLACYRLVLFD